MRDGFDLVGLNLGDDLIAYSQLDKLSVKDFDNTHKIIRELRHFVLLLFGPLFPRRAEEKGSKLHEELVTNRLATSRTSEVFHGKVEHCEVDNVADSVVIGCDLPQLPGAQLLLHQVDVHLTHYILVVLIITLPRGSCNFNVIFELGHE